MRICPLASGSKGNTTYISDGTTTILLDAGISGTEIERRLRSRHLHPQDLDAIVVSHEHTDHIRGAGPLARRLKIPVYISARTLDAAASALGPLPEARRFVCGKGFRINTLRLHPFAVSHDAVDPAGFTIAHNGLKIGVATDLGIATNVVKTHLQHCRLLILEANHDAQMLDQGPYPWPLKQRIKSRWGHLSNSASRALLAELGHDRLAHVILAHLSETNNTATRALREVREALGDGRTKLTVAQQHQAATLIRIDA
jgi:phosphoribosyl 1,2-cyclic phosphodiesterase